MTLFDTFGDGAIRLSFRYDYSPWAIDSDHKPVYVLYMMRDIFEMHSQ